MESNSDHFLCIAHRTYNMKTFSPLCAAFLPQCQVRQRGINFDMPMILQNTQDWRANFRS